MSELQVKVYQHNMTSTFRCDLCGGEVQEDFAGAVIVEKGTKNYFAHDVCAECLDAGRDGAAKRMLDYAAKLRDWAADIEKGSDDIRNIATEDWSAWAAVEAMSAKANAEYAADTVIQAPKFEGTVLGDDDLPF